MNWYRDEESWFFILRRYLPRLAFCSLAWEILQLPLYTLWSEPNPWWIAYAVAHCTVGDGMIGTGAVFGALTLTRAHELASWPRTKLAILMILLALGYTIFSERNNLSHGNWAYSPSMPVVPWVKIGIAPLLQWLLMPLAAWNWAQHGLGMLRRRLH